MNVQVSPTSPRTARQQHHFLPQNRRSALVQQLQSSGRPQHRAALLAHTHRLAKCCREGNALTGLSTGLRSLHTSTDLASAA